VPGITPTADEGHNFRWWLLGAGVVTAFAIGLFILFILIDLAFVAWGVFGSMLFFAGLALLFGYIYDRRHARSNYSD